MENTVVEGLIQAEYIKELMVILDEMQTNNTSIEGAEALMVVQDLLEADLTTIRERLTALISEAVESPNAQG